jgi:hypothetical protein
MEPICGWGLLAIILNSNHMSIVVDASVKLYTRCLKIENSNVPELPISKVFKNVIVNFGYENNTPLLSQLCECILVLAEKQPDLAMALLVKIIPQVWL